MSTDFFITHACAEMQRAAEAGIDPVEAVQLMFPDIEPQQVDALRKIEQKRLQKKRKRFPKGEAERRLAQALA